MALDIKKRKIPTGGGVKQDLIPIGMERARVVQILDLGLQARRAWNKQKKNPAYQVWITYELVDCFMKDEDGNDVEDKPRWISEQVNVFSLDQENATSTKRCKALDTTGELEGNLGLMGGLPCLIQIVHRKDGQYANIGSVSPPMKGETPELQNPVVLFDIDEPDMEIFEGLPEFLKEKMMNNLEFEGSPLQAAINGEEYTPPVETQQKDVVDEDDDEEPPY